ncbi:Hypothetical_protein [Hexamita inflata]|uniref:Hypothetical_protein n=1 Tax=Hexamita inflata TaxID=28002 RepID=A0AA86RFJ2_9EUKA|nr:Hypothetical protein HINF_LOCUS64430 [Hexamita inflata]
MTIHKSKLSYTMTLPQTISTSYLIFYVCHSELHPQTTSLALEPTLLSSVSFATIYGQYRKIQTELTYITSAISKQKQLIQSQYQQLHYQLLFSQSYYSDAVMTLVIKSNPVYTTIRLFKHTTINLQTPLRASFQPFQLFNTHFKTYHQNKRVNVHIPPKLQLHVLEALSSNDVNMAISSSHTNSKSDSVEFTKWLSLTNQSGRCSELMDQINSSSYQLMIQLKRTEYLSNCSSKNEAVLKTLEKNKACMHKSLGK